MGQRFIIDKVELIFRTTVGSDEGIRDFGVLVPKTKWNYWEGVSGLSHTVSLE